jgi:hypothetical protein
MARIVSDPALDFQPDFASVTFEGLRNRVIGGMQMTHEEDVAGSPTHGNKTTTLEGQPGQGKLRKTPV